jgi:hypothetical protein
LLVACGPPNPPSAPACEPQSITDNFLRQRTALDLVVVVDGQSELGPYRAGLERMLLTMESEWRCDERDWRAVVISSDGTGRSIGAPGHPEVVHHDMPNALASVLANIDVASQRGGPNRLFETADRLEALRSGADLQIELLSTRDDASSEPLDAHQRSASRAAARVRVVAPGLEDSPYCSAPLPATPRLNAFVSARGQQATTCDLCEAGEGGCGSINKGGGCGYAPKRPLLLSRVPIVATVQVRVAGTPVPADDPRGARIWSYLTETNAVVFEPLFSPNVDVPVTVSYRALCLQ